MNINHLKVDSFLKLQYHKQEKILDLDIKGFSPWTTQSFYDDISTL